MFLAVIYFKYTLRLFLIYTSCFRLTVLLRTNMPKGIIKVCTKKDYYVMVFIVNSTA